MFKKIIGAKKAAKRSLAWSRGFIKRNGIGLAIIFFATVVFFLPLLKNLTSYSEGGDAMFNAWTLSRNHHCLLSQGCPRYTDANIYFPHKDTMLYSETQLSAGVATLPFYFLTKNPITTYNVWTVVSFLLSGWFMYLLVKYLSKGNQVYSIVAGLIFEFAPFKMAAVWHLQNLSIFCLPLALLCVLKYVDTRAKRYLAVLFITLLYQFYASWYQLVFSALALVVFVACLRLFKRIDWRQAIAIAGVIVVAGIFTLPLAKEYIRFSKANKASFGIADQALYSSSVSDYFIPNKGTASAKLYEKAFPRAPRQAFNADSYSYHGITLYFLFASVLFMYIRKLKDKKFQQSSREFLALSAMGAVGLVLSFGPLLKIQGSYFYSTSADGLKAVIPMPYIIVDKLLPQISFIRAIGRISVLFLVLLCCSLGYFALYLKSTKLSLKKKRLITSIIVAALAFELLPLHLLPVSKNSYAANFRTPHVYSYIRKHSDINNLVILRTSDYPGAPFDVARAEDVLWAGFHNRNIYNGYSGYTPPKYFKDLSDFVNFDQDDLAKMKHTGIHYILADKQLINKPQIIQNVRAYGGLKIYEDNRYLLTKVQ